MSNSDIDKYRKPISGVKSKPEFGWSVSNYDIEKFNYSLASKLRQNRNESIASYHDVINDNSNFKSNVFTLKKTTKK